MTSDRRHVPHDWYAGDIPPNVVVGPDTYLDSSYGFAPFGSEESPGLVLGEACGVYNRATLIVGPRGLVTVGPYSVLNETYVICHERVTIGAHCLLSWGVVVSDSWHAAEAPRAARRSAMVAAAADPHRRLPPLRAPAPVVVEDNVWVGFDAVVLPGVRLGRGCVVGCRTVVDRDVPPYAVLAGDPARVVRTLRPDDTVAVREVALRECRRREPELPA